jgi:uncharacterized phage protein gp47/JayE
MIDFSTGYSYREILDAMLDQVDSGLDKREGSLIQTALGPLAWYLEGLALTLSNVQKAAYAETAEGEDLDLLAATRGLTRRAAVAAVRQGTFNVAIPDGSLFRTVNGDSSVLFMSGEQISTSGGLYVYRMTCQTPGVIGNSYSGNITPVTAIAGLTTAVLGTIITEGADQESDAALRVRYVASFDTAPYGGNISEYRQAILAISGVGAVQIYPANQYHGGGTALCSIVNADFGPASSALVKTVQDIICPPEDGQTAPSPNGYGIAPIGAAVDIVSATAVTINVSCRIIFASGVEDGLASYGDEIRAAVAEYIHSVAEDWGKALVSNRITYPVTVYASRIIYAILTIPEVASVADLTINGASGDLTLTETAALQQVPVLGEVTLNG